MKLWLMLLLVCIATALVGCKKGRTLEGDWTNQMNGGQTSFHFDNKGGFTTAGAANGFTVSGSGSYALKDADLTLTIQHMDISNPKMSKQQMDAVRAMAKMQEGKAQTGKMEWKTDDQFVFTTTPANGAQAQTITFDRKK
jgi:hypothetical protein